MLERNETSERIDLPLVYRSAYLYIQYKLFMYIELTCKYFVHNHSLLPIRSNQPCGAGKSQPHTGSAPAEQPPSSPHSDPLTDHPGATCHVQTATAKCLPHTRCCHACHPVQQCRSCPLGRQNSCACCTCEEWLVLSYQPGTRGSVELCPPCWLLEPNKSMELERAHTTWSHQHHLGRFCNLNSSGAWHFLDSGSR